MEFRRVLFRSLAERDRKQRAMAVNDVEADQQRNSKPRFLDGDALHLVRRAGADHVQQIADRAVADRLGGVAGDDRRSEEHTSELQSLMRISYAVFCLKKKKPNQNSQRLRYDLNK